jgi:hypothetical protein
MAFRSFPLAINAVLHERKPPRILLYVKVFGADDDREPGLIDGGADTEDFQEGDPRAAWVGIDCAEIAEERGAEETARNATVT